MHKEFYYQIIELRYTEKTTVNGERFTGLNIRSFGLMKFSRKHFCGALASGVFYLKIAKYSWKTFTVLLKTAKTKKVQPSESFPIYGRYIGYDVKYMFIRILNYVYTVITFKNGKVALSLHLKNVLDIVRIYVYAFGHGF